MPRPALRRRVLVALASLLVILAATGLLGRALAPLGNLARSIAAPLASLGGRFGNATTALGDPELRAQLDAAQIENAKLSLLRVENAELKAALAYRERIAETLLAAHVVARTADDVFHGLVLDKGSEDGVVPGQPVIAGDGVIIGKVHAVKERTASVMLLSDGRSRLAVTVGDDVGTTGVLEGERGISARVTLVPATSSIAPGQPVVTSGLEAGIRRGLLVGTIDQVTRNAQDPFQSATILPFDAAVNPSLVQIVLGE